MLRDEKPSLSVCAFGAGAAHAALIALVLPIMITLPAPTDKSGGAIAIQVVVRSKLPPPLEAATAKQAALVLPPIGEGDVDDDAMPAVFLGEATGTLPRMSAVSGVIEENLALLDPRSILPAVAVKTLETAALPLVDSVPAPHAEADVRDDAIAYIDSTEVPISETRPAIVSERSRKPAQANIPKQRAKRVAPGPRASATRAAPAKPVRPAAPKPVFKGFLGGRQATTMPEYPFADR